MKTSILSRHQEVDETIKRYVHQRIQSALKLLITQVQDITVHLSAEHAADGSRQKACEIEIQLGENQLVVVKSNTSHWLAAIDQAVEAAARAVRRKLSQTLKTIALKPMVIKGSSI
jgi:ribosomal subunit interface protein